MSKRGFTLAEVLITLAIIGVIAAMTIPALMQSNDDAATIARVKKAQVVLSNAVALYEQQNDCIGDLRSCGLFPSSSSLSDADRQAIWDKFKGVFNFAKDCGVTYTWDCLPDNPQHKNLQGWEQDLNGSPYAKGILTDGSILIM